VFSWLQELENPGGWDRQLLDIVEVNFG